MDSQTKYTKLLHALSLHGKLAIAFSGGVDSTFLLAAAVEAGCEVLALTADSELIPQWEREEATGIARTYGVEHRFVRIHPLDNPEVSCNSPERCYHCKRIVMSKLKEVAAEHGFAVLIEGTNSSDCSDHRPGMQAVREEGVISPLLDLGIFKDEVRKFSRDLNVPGFDRPSCACLASRIPYGTPLSTALLAQVQQAEISLRGLGLEGARVRINGDTARIEVPLEDFPKVIQPKIRREIVAQLSAAGFVYVSLDLNGYRSGSMNEVLDRR